MNDYPHSYGDCDACGDPEPLLAEVEAQARRLGISLSTRAHNSYDLGISIGGYDMLRLLAVLSDTTNTPEQATIQDLAHTYIDGYKP